jgi:Apea-like HEPN
MPEANQSSAADQIDASVLAWVEAAIGDRLLSYLLGSDIAALPLLVSGETASTEKQLEVTAIFSNLRQNIPSELDDVTSKEMVRNFVTQITDKGKSIARSIREYAVSSEAPPDGKNAVERSLAALAVDAYPACLLSPDPALPPGIHDLGPHLATILFRHPQLKAFSKAVLGDRVLKNIFLSNDERLGRTATVYRNTGSGGDLQLLMLPDMLLRSTWRKLPGETPTLNAFASVAIEELRLVRDVISGKQRTVTALLAFTGVLLSPGRDLRINDGIVRAVTEVDRRLVPESLKGQINTTDPSGTAITVNYDGDVVLEYEFPYTVQVRPRQTEPPSTWPVEMRPPLAMEQTVTRLRFSLMLAAERNYRVQLVPIWRTFNEPLAPGIARSWSDPRHGASFMPTQLTDAEMAAWGEWYNKLNTPDVARIELALSRILRAVAERREPSDVLVDSVIAWENLFGTKEGEPTFRVTMCLAKLLEQGTAARLALKTRLGKIYALRSKVVHGGGALRENEYPLCHEALDVSIRAVRVLAAEREDVLRLADGAKRSAALLLGE